jgi:hypothetical protein
MVTNYPRIASNDRLRPATEEADSVGAGVRAWDWVRQAFCGLHGHDTMLNFEQERMSLRCVSCGHETPGWELNEVPPTVTNRGDNRRHAMAGAQFVGARRVA